MSSAQSLFEAILIWLIMCIFSVVLLFSIAMPWDIMLPLFQAAGMDNVGSTWNTTGDRDLLGQLIYVVIYVLPILGGINFFATATRQTEYDTIYQR
jgi:hypothetical protein